MLTSAQISRIPISYLYHEHKDLEKLKVRIDDLFNGKSFVKDMGFAGEVYDLIESNDENDLLSKLELSLKKFYLQN